MCADVARSHGGDCGGGGDPPHRHSGRIPASCQTSKPKNQRGPTKGKKLEAVWRANGQMPLPVMFDRFEKTYSGIGDNGTMMNNMIGSLIRSFVPPYFLTWDDVPGEYKAQILPRLESFFDLGRNTDDWTAINEGLDRYCANRYSGAKYRLHQHFHRNGGLKDVDKARRSAPSRLKPADWNKLIDDIFLNADWQKRSTKNSENRAKQPFVSFHGSRSYINTRFKKMNNETQEIQGSIDNWHDTHYKTNHGWASEQARLAYEKLVAEKELQTQRASSSTPEGSAVNEGEIFRKVFGDRRGHNIGVGRKLRRLSGLPSSSTTPAPPSNEKMLEAWDKHNEEQNRKRYEDLVAYFLSHVPNANPANAPPFVSTPFDYNAYIANQASQQQQSGEDLDEDN